MLNSLKAMQSSDIQASDGRIGHVKDFYFDDHSWTLRYVVADTGNWLPGRLVLLSPESLQAIDASKQSARFDLTTEQIESSPTIETNAPVSRKHEAELARHYGWPTYWSPMAFPAVGYAPIGVAPRAEAAPVDQTPPSEPQGPQLRSFDEVRGYGIRATDDEFGQLEDLLVEVETQRLRYMVVDTRKWLPGKTVLAGVHWINEIDWMSRQILLSVTKDQVKEAPSYDESEAITREMEVELHEHYGLPAYWDKESPHNAESR